PQRSSGDAPCRTSAAKCALCTSACPTCWCVFDEPGKRSRVQELEKQSANPALWDDPSRAQALLKELADLQADLEPWQALKTRIEEAQGLLDLAIDEGDEEIAAEVGADVPSLKSELDKLE